MLTLDRFIIITVMDNNDNDDGDKQYFKMQRYKPNVSFRYEQLELEDNDNDNDKEDIFFNLWNNNFDLQKKIHITDDLKIHYRHDSRCLIFKLKIDNINGTIEKSKYIENMLQFRPTSLIQTGLIYNMLGVFEDKLCKKLQISFLDIIDRLGMFRINTKQHIPLNTVVYLRDLIVVFDRVDKVNYKGKIKYCIVCNIVKGDILLQK